MRLPLEPSRRAERPTMLMLSHCVPDALGSADRARAWQMLTLASRTHEVYLACLLDGPVRLSQWRAVFAVTRRLAIEPPGWGWRLAGPRLAGNLRELAPSRAPILDLERALADVVDQRFDVALCTSAALWEALASVRAGRRLCDLHVPLAAQHHTAARLGPIRWRWQHRRLAHLHEAIERHAAQQADQVFLADDTAMECFGNLTDSWVTVPPAVDVQAIRSSIGCAMWNGRSIPRVVIHCAATTLSARRQAGALAEHLRAGITFGRQRSRRIELSVHSSGSVERLGAARVVAVPEMAAGLGEWATLQGLATDRLVVMPRSLCERLELGSSENVDVVDRPDHWVRQVARALQRSHEFGGDQRHAHTLIQGRHDLRSAPVNPFEVVERPALRLTAA